MNNTHIATATSTHPAQANLHPTIPAETELDMKVEWLPFTVRLVQSDQDLEKAVRIRHSAYARHVPEFAKQLQTPEALDTDRGIVIFLAESKVDGSPIGTMRIQTNRYAPLMLEQSLELPAWAKGCLLAEATRLGVTQQGVGRLVKTALFKAFYQYCKAVNVQWMVVTGRSPIDRQYERLMFEDVYPGMGYIPLRHVNNMPHRVMALDVAGVEEKWRAANVPFTDFFFNKSHPDIETQAPSWLSLAA